MPEINLDDTITAIATPIGEGGISVIRISGPETFSVLEKVFYPKSGEIASFASHTIHYGEVKDVHGRVLDQALLSLFRAPRSYTGQEVAELSSHGGLVVTRQILDLLIQAGARHAEPGEFTKRAFLNGKIDLAQAEAVLDIIRAKSEKSLEIAVRQLSGSLSQKLKSLKDELMKMYAHMEAFLDFPEDQLEVYQDKTFGDKFRKSRKDLGDLIAGFQRGVLLREGALVAIIGKPNVGKSSLFNALLSRDRALVSEYPGTTRDSLEEAIEIGGFYLRLVDTAGLSQNPESESILDKMGMEKTKEILRAADCFLFMVDGSTALEEADKAAYQEIKNLEKEKPALVLINKFDLPQKLNRFQLKTLTQNENFLEISIKNRCGLEEIERALSKVFTSPEAEGEQITRLRHRNVLEEALTALQRAQEAFDRRESLEFVVVDLKKSIDTMRELVGEIYSEDLLDVIFSEFCIGK